MKKKLHSLILLALIFKVNFSNAGMDKKIDPDMLLNMSIEELLNRKITSVSKKPQQLKEISSAVYVINQDEIKRSGATTIPEILRMAPGVHVARIDSNKWSVSIRGFSDIFANDLLVMIDGRSIYNLLFGGVYWDVQDTMIEDIERVEVIRGPGATVWGANAVNGVINIITKKAKDTQGGLVSAAYGSEAQGFGGIRYGGKLGHDNYFRLYAKAQKQDNSKLQAGGDAYDGRHQEQTGFKIDLAENSDDPVTLQGDFYHGVNRIVSRTDSLMPFVFDQNKNDHEIVRGGNVLTRWQHKISDTSNTSLQLYYDYNYRSSGVMTQARHTVDIDFQHVFKYDSWNEVTWGAGYRFSGDDMNGTFIVDVQPAERNTHLYSGFIQDEVSLLDDTVKLTAGIKLSHNDFSGFEYQPTARALWRFSDKQSIWASFSRAVRTPSRFDQNGIINNTIPGIPVPTVLTVQGNPGFNSERMYAYEVGYRALITDNLHVDVAVFYNDYDNLRGSGMLTPSCQPSGGFPPCFSPEDTHFNVPVSLGENNLKGETYGGEFTVRWKMNDVFSVNGSYSLLQMQIHSKQGIQSDEREEHGSPQHIASLQPSFKLWKDLSLDFWIRYTDQIRSIDIPNVVNIDTRLSWKPVKDLEVSLVGQNILEESHQEFITSQSNAPATRVERGVYGQIRWQF